MAAAVKLLSLVNRHLAIALMLLPLYIAVVIGVFNICCDAIGLVRMVNYEYQSEYKNCGGHLCNQNNQQRLF